MRPPNPAQQAARKARIWQHLRREYRRRRTVSSELVRLLGRRDVYSLIFWGELEHRLGAVWLMRKAAKLRQASGRWIKHLWG